MVHPTQSDRGEYIQVTSLCPFHIVHLCCSLCVHHLCACVALLARGDCTGNNWDWNASKSLPSLPSSSRVWPTKFESQTLGRYVFFWEIQRVRGKKKKIARRYATLCDGISVAVAASSLSCLLQYLSTKKWNKLQIPVFFPVPMQTQEPKRKRNNKVNLLSSIVSSGLGGPGFNSGSFACLLRETSRVDHSTSPLRRQVVAPTNTERRWGQGHSIIAELCLHVIYIYVCLVFAPNNDK